MKCPICGKELELQNRQVGTDDNGTPIFNQYAVCRDCRKQWNLDKQRAKKAAEKKAHAPEEPAAADSPKKADSAKKPPVHKAPAPARSEKEHVQREAVSKDGETMKKPMPRKRPSDTEKAEEHRDPAKAKRPRPDSNITPMPASPKKKPLKRRSETSESKQNDSVEEKRYSNIPSEKVRNKREKVVRKGYEDMLATGKIDSPMKKKAAPDSTAPKKRPDKEIPAKVSTKQPEPETDVDEYDDYYEDTPRFCPARIILGIISLIGFGFFIYKGFTLGLSAASEGSSAVSGMTFIILALCVLVSALLYFIMLKTNSIFAFLLPMLFYLGCGVYAFLNKGDSLELLITAVASIVLAVISLILAITSRGGDYDDDEEYDDEEYDDEYDE